MNDDFRAIEQRLAKADPNAPELSEQLLQKSIDSKKRRLPNRNAARFVTASIVGIAGISVVLTSIPSGNQPLITLADRNTSSTTAEAGLESQDSIATDSMPVDFLPGWINPFEYSVGADLSDEPGSGPVYKLELDGTPSENLREFASIFGQRGNVELEQWSTEFYPSYKLETEEAYFSLYWHGSGMINYSSKRNWLPEECYLTDEDLVEDEITPRRGCEPLPVVPMPEESVLRVEAFEIITEAGFEGSKEDISVERYEWGASAFATARVDGIETAIEWYVSWDQTGEISNVSGHLARPVLAGEFETISPAAAVSRISQGYWFGAAPRSFYDYSAQSSTSIAIDEPATEQDLIEEDMEILPVEPMPEPGEMETVQLIVESSTPATLLIEDSEGTGWLVPGYMLKTDHGWFESIVALEEGLIQTPG